MAHKYNFFFFFHILCLYSFTFEENSNVLLNNMGIGTVFSLGLVALVAFLAGPISHFVQITGVFLTPNSTVLGESQGPIYIEDTIHCEDVHHYRPANLLFTACEDNKNIRFSWFPPLGHLLPLTAQGSIHVVDPKVRLF
jgi:hypothetical protein